MVPHDILENFTILNNFIDPKMCIYVSLDTTFMKK
jgi:hypothetical protein